MDINTNTSNENKLLESENSKALIQKTDFNNVPVSIDKKKKKKKNRCFVCNKKLGLIPYSCRCNNELQFCAIHRYPESHNCSFDWKKDSIEKLAKLNPKIEGDKFSGNKI